MLTLDILRDVEIQVKNDPKTNNKSLVFVVSETNPWYALPVLGNDLLFGLYGGFKVGYKNFRGRREKLGLRVRLGRLKIYNIEWSNPWFAGPLHLFSNIHLQHEEYDYLYSDYSPDFHYHNGEAAFTLGFRPIREIALGIRASYERIEVNDFSVSFSGNGVDKIQSVQPYIELNTRDWEFYPRRGWYAKVLLRKYFHSVVTFKKTEVDIRRYQPITGNRILALRLTSVLLRGNVPVYKRTHLGGSGSLRGYTRGQFAGENKIAGSIEWRMPVGFQPSPENLVNVGLAAVFFVDTGTTWWTGERWPPKRFHSSAGAGFHLLLHEVVLSCMYGHTGRGYGFLHVSTQIEF